MVIFGGSKNISSVHRCFFFVEEEQIFLESNLTGLGKIFFHEVANKIFFESAGVYPFSPKFLLDTPNFPILNLLILIS